MYPKYPDNIKEISDNYQATTEHSTTPITSTVSTIKNQTDAVAGYQHVHISGY